MQHYTRKVSPKTSLLTPECENIVEDVLTDQIQFTFMKKFVKALLKDDP